MTVEQLEQLRGRLRSLVDGYIDNLIDDHREGGACSEPDCTLLPSDALADMAETLDPADNVLAVDAEVR